MTDSITFVKAVWIKATNLLLAGLYCVGAIAILFPQSVIPQEFGMVALGIMLLITGIFGEPFLDSDRCDLVR
jgi:VIT1/CCC1 family predicted Fe2+/Mn2+ transporter